MESLEETDYSSQYLKLCRKYDMDPINMNLQMNQIHENGFNEMIIKWTLSGQSKKLSSQEKIDNMKKVILFIINPLNIIFLFILIIYFFLII